MTLDEAAVLEGREEHWWDRELALMRQLNGQGVLETYVATVLKYRRLTFTGTPIAHESGRWWARFYRARCIVAGCLQARRP